MGTNKRNVAVFVEDITGNIIEVFIASFINNPIDMR